MPFPILPNEAERLEAFARLDIPSGALPPGLDRICAIAQTLFQVPVVLMVFLGENTAWIKRGQGAGLSGAPRDLSFCNYTIMHDEVFVIPDAKADGRFATHPYVTADPGLRFYAGAPFITAPGIRVGSICLVDHVPRDFTARQTGLLSSLARIAVDELWLQHLERVGLAAADDIPPRRTGHDFDVVPCVTGAQVRAARGLLNWSVRELADAANVAPMTVKRLEGSGNRQGVSDHSITAVREALECAGVEFTFAPGTSPGVRPR